MCDLLGKIWEVQGEGKDIKGEQRWRKAQKITKICGGFLGKYLVDKEKMIRSLSKANILLIFGLQICCLNSRHYFFV